MTSNCTPASLLRRLVNDLGGESLATASPPARIKTVTPPKTISPSEPAAGTTRVRQKDGMLMVYVPAGEFLMGSTDADKDAESNEKPQHKVYLDAYWIDQTPLTNAIYARFLNEPGNQEQEIVRWYEPDYGRIKQDGKVWRVENGFEQHPVVSVTWYGARAYAGWVGAQLPTEAQWEKAARGTDGRQYPWGNQVPDKTLANLNDYVGNTTAVGSYPSGASPYGALDMAGNVWEWVADWYGETNYSIRSTWRNPTGPESGALRVLRGGSWYNDLRYARCAFRSWDYPGDRNRDFGFRLSLRNAP
jgi:formylglycine-generating enzyme required for sulfatase activity